MTHKSRPSLERVVSANDGYGGTEASLDETRRKAGVTETSGEQVAKVNYYKHIMQQ
jgi:hypothetical protein